MVFNATFNNISVILWRSALLVEETRVHLYLEKTKHLPQVTDKLYHVYNVVSNTSRHEWDLTHNFSGDRDRLLRQLVVNPTII